MVTNIVRGSRRTGEIIGTFEKRFRKKEKKGRSIKGETTSKRGMGCGLMVGVVLYR